MAKRVSRKRLGALLFIVVVVLNLMFWQPVDPDKDIDPKREQQNLSQQEPEKLPNTPLPPSAPIVSSGTIETQATFGDDDFNYTTYLPATVSVIPRFYANTRKWDSLSMMLPPRHYQLMKCPGLLMRHHLEYNRVSERINFTEGPLFSVPGFFYNPYPLCGRYLLSYLMDGRHPYVFVLRVESASSTSSTLKHNTMTVKAGTWSDDVIIEQCGQCVELADVEDRKDPCAVDILFMARLLSDHRVLHAEALPGDGLWRGGRRVASVIRFRVHDPGEYALEVKMVHVNGTSSVPEAPKTLGLVGTRATVNGRKSFLYGEVCDIQRNVYGSPLRVRVLPAVDVPATTIPPFCNFSTNYNSSEGGQWVRFIDGAEPDTPEGSPHPLAANCITGDRYCYGNPISLTDSCGHNNHLVWVPSTCRLRIFQMNSGGPSTGCLRTHPLRLTTAYVLFLGDSVMREYKSNCDAMRFSPKGSQLVCAFANIAPEGKYASPEYISSVVRAMLESVTNNRPLGVFATNLGIQHMIGKATMSQWTMLLDTFVHEWRKQNVTVLRGPYTTMPPFGAPAAEASVGDSEWQRYMWEQNRRSRSIMNSTKPMSTPYMEWAIWISPPTVHYSRYGMTYQRELLWDRVAYERLQKIGFIRLDTVTPTLSRPEGSWDGLHQLSQLGKVQSPWRNRKAATHKFNGGVSFMLFLILTNVICYS
ncbi:hypothetical protein DQ04_08751020 [Trypanosoma grayi]|uniref:hypothetical protein n=1 Tax=Trypanosoma grayi TaxID=71804 RepID=UPI0004F42941|nr:hypothetical protein DQ04_08751020 [Trypanosoma grayi]KEG07816.1 hypothetical protein DQ04_08751020 [Trypanosoma grayi]